MPRDPMKTRDKGSLLFLLFLFLWPVILLALFLAGVRVWEAAQKPVIRHRVMEYRDGLTAQAEYDLAAPNGTVRTRDAMIPGSGDAIWYETARFGPGPSSRAYGYCCSAGGDPRPYPGMEDYDAAPVGSGFRWEEPGGDNGCYVEHIAGDFYYYEVWF